MCVLHKAGVDMPSETPLRKIQLLFDQQNIERYRVLFNSAHCIAKKDWSLHCFADLITLQQKNGQYVGQNYQNDKGVSDFLQHIAEVQRLKTKCELKECRFFSVMGDGSTDRSVTEQEAVYIRCVIDGVGVNKFVGLQDLDTAGILQAMDTALATRASIDLDTQKTKIINVNLDGASVNMGIYNGVAAQLQERNGPHLMVTHCINHNK